jgi:hypothetical protein
MRLYIGFLFLAGVLPAQNRIALSGGWGEQISVYPAGRQTAPVLSVSYGYRPLKWFEVETGLMTALQPGQTLCSAHGCFDPDDRYFWVPFGARFVAPIGWKRVELSAGGGGLYERYSVRNGTSNPFNIASYDGWGGYFAGGAAVKVTHRIWLGATPRFLLANPKYRRDRWFTITGEVSSGFEESTR